MFGKVTKEENRNLKDMDLREFIVLAPMVLIVFWIGLYPNFFLSRIEPSAELFLSRMKTDKSVELRIDKSLTGIDNRLVLSSNPEKWSE